MAGRGWWRMGDGKLVAISDMDDRHLINTIRFVRRHIAAAHEASMYIGHGDDGWIESKIVEDQIIDMDEKCDELILEANRRGLKW